MGDIVVSVCDLKSNNECVEINFSGIKFKKSMLSQIYIALYFV